MSVDHSEQAVAAPACGLAAQATGNDLPVLHEIRHGLARLLDVGEGKVIDLRAMPMAPGEEDRIEAFLGRGELRAELDALGPSEVLETRYAGVWLVTHRNAAGEIIGKFIEITHCPDILRSQAEDMGIALIRLDTDLAGSAQAYAGSGAAE